MPVNNQPDPKKNVSFVTPYDINNLCYTRQISRSKFGAKSGLISGSQAHT